MGLTTYKDGTFTQEAADSLRELDRLTPTIPVYVMQGGWNAGGVSASAGTHDRDAVDIAAAHLTPAQRAEIVRCLRAMGWAAWLRTPAQGFAWHIHAVPAGWGDVSQGAAYQVREYLAGRNGLVSRARDDGPRDWVGRTWADYVHDDLLPQKIAAEQAAAAERHRQEQAEAERHRREEDEMAIAEIYGVQRPDGVEYRIRTANGEVALGSMAMVDACASALNARAKRTYGPNGWANPVDYPCLGVEADTLRNVLDAIELEDRAEQASRMARIEEALRQVPRATVDELGQIR